jgi:hypothetical protein
MVRIREKGKKQKKNTGGSSDAEIRIGGKAAPSEKGPVKGPYIKFEWERPNGQESLLLDKKRLSRKEVFQQLLSHV